MKFNTSAYVKIKIGQRCNLEQHVGITAVQEITHHRHIKLTYWCTHIGTDMGTDSDNRDTF